MAMGQNKPPVKFTPIPDDEPSEGPILDSSLESLARNQANKAMQEVRENMQGVREKVGGRVAGFVAVFLPGSSIPFDKLIFFLSLLMLAAAYPLALKGPSAIPYLAYGLPPIFLFGYLWRSRVLAILAVILALASFGEGYGLISHWKAKEAEQKQQAIAAEAEKKRLAAEAEEAAKKAEADRIEREAKEAAAKVEA
jgi:hypothetical protein